MKEYKGIYHDTKDTTKLYEFGAHFKYSELFQALKNIQIKQENNETLNENNNISLNIKSNAENELTKKRKKYKLKSMNLNINNRYNLVTENKETNKNNIDTIQEEEDNENEPKINRSMAKSLDKVLLPTIYTNNINNKDIYSRRKNKNQYRLTERFINEDKNTYNPIKLNRSSDFKNKSKEGKKEFPKINSFYYNNILHEDKDQIETQSRFKESIIGKDFLPKGSGIVTRRPLILQLINQKEGEDYCEFFLKPNEKIKDFSKVTKEIISQTEKIAGKEKLISDKPIIMKIFSSKLIDLTLVDLPGLVKVPLKGQPDNIDSQIKKKN